MQRVYASNTTVRSIELTEAESFVATHGTQNLLSVGGDPRAFGLFLDKELISVALFCNPKTPIEQRDYTTELLSVTTRSDYHIIDGISKLVTHFIEKVNPADIFIKQSVACDSAEELTRLGFSLKSDDESKFIFVKNGLTQSDVKNNRSDWFSMYEVINLDLNELLNTDIGESLDADGNQMSNEEILVQLYDYHREELSGEGVYEWHNPNVSYYCYKLSAPSRDNKYYIGRKRINLPSPDEEQCRDDGYFGSGGLKFKNWVNLVDKNNLVKQILGIYSSHKEAVRAESEFVGNKHKSDPNCLNTIAGGRFSPVLRNKAKVAMQHCDEHGLVIHFGNTCATCTSQGSVSMRECSAHGLTKHQGDVCNTCNSQRSVMERECPTHGLTKFQGDHCMKCNAASQLALMVCTVHGEVTHKGGTCTFCTASKSISLKVCAVHGETKHQGEVCNLCNSQKSVNLRECPKHGVTKHQGSTCNKCNAQRSVVERECETHGLSKFQGEKCVKCRNAALITVKDCPVHGAWKHRGKSCYACISDRRKAKKNAG